MWRRLHVLYFNPRTHVGCDVATFSGIFKTRNFNPRTHVGCDAIVKSSPSASSYFNPRTHVGCDSIQKEASVCSVTFQSTHPRGVRQNIASLPRSVRRFQSTHPRGVRQKRGVFKKLDLNISIHAPTWGATPCNFPGWCGRSPFQSTHPRGVRPAQRAADRELDNFNPRTHVGCDVIRLPLRGIFAISIHAPTWGATFEFTGELSALVFQSTHPRGVRPYLAEHYAEKIKFQSTHPRGVRRREQVRGRDVRLISIHAPTWGATVKPSNGWLLGHKDNEFANENIIIINSVNIT